MMAVMQVEIREEDSGIRLDRWFRRYYPGVRHGQLEKALRTGQIRLDGKRAKASTRVEVGQIVRVPPFSEQAVPEKGAASPKRTSGKEEKILSQLQQLIIYKDEDIVVLNKPAGLAVQGGSGVSVSIDSLLDGLKFEKEERPRLVHRIDKDTSGLLLLARSARAAAALTEAFRNKDMKKQYIAVVSGVPRPAQGKIDLPLAKAAIGGRKEKMHGGVEGGKDAVSLYKTLDYAGQKAALMQLEPITGRTHQLRVHMQAIGHPILGDGKYGGRDAFIQGLSNKLHLHAYRLVLPNWKGKTRQWEAPISEHIAETLQMLGMNF